MIVFLTSVGKLMFQIGVPSALALAGLILLGTIADKKGWTEQDTFKPIWMVILFAGIWVLSWYIIGQITWVQGLK